MCFFLSSFAGIACCLSNWRFDRILGLFFCKTHYQMQTCKIGVRAPKCAERFFFIFDEALPSTTGSALQLNGTCSQKASSAMKTQFKKVREGKGLPLQTNSRVNSRPAPRESTSRGLCICNISVPPIDTTGVPDIDCLGLGLIFKFCPPCRTKQTRRSLCVPTIHSWARLMCPTYWLYNIHTYTHTCRERKARKQEGAGTENRRKTTNSRESSRSPRNP